MKTLLPLFLFCTFWAFAQQSAGQTSSSPPAGTQATSNAGANAGANVTFDPTSTSTANVPRQFVTALPGVTGTAGVIPGVPVLGNSWDVYLPPFVTSFTMDEIDRMKRKDRGMEI